MKKIIALLTSVILLSGMTMTGCSAKSVQAKGTEGAKLLLAHNRLQAEQLKGELGFLQENSSIRNVSTQKKSKIAPLSSVQRTSQIKAAADTAYDKYGFKKEGDTYYWSQFPDSSSQSLGYYQSYFLNLETSAEHIAMDIESVKRGVNLTDIWVEYDNHSSLMLSVDGETETIFRRFDETYENEINVCTRYTNERGEVVYERYVHSPYGTAKMTYSPGKYYEYVDPDRFLFAENDRGYWTMGEVMLREESVHVRSTAFMNEIGIETSYYMTKQEANGGGENAGFVSGDKTRDLFSIDGNFIRVYLCGLNGVSHVKSSNAQKQATDKNGHTVYALEAVTDGVLVTNGGKEIKAGDTFASGAVEFERVNVSFDYYNGDANPTEEYYGTMELRLNETDTYEEKVAALQAFLQETGLSIKEDFNVMNKAKAQADSVRGYYSWNGICIDDVQAAKECLAYIQREYAKKQAQYDAVKDREVISASSVRGGEITGDFAQVSGLSKASYQNGKITVSDLKITAKNSPLFEQGEEYKVMLAVARKEGEDWQAQSVQPLQNQTEGALVAYNTGELTAVYAGEGLLPMGILNGEYKVVAYIATKNGIRVSKLMELSFADGVDAASYALPGSKVAPVLEETTVTFYYQESIDKMIEITGKSEYTYQEIFNALMVEVAKHGTPTYAQPVVESYDASTQTSTAIDKDETYAHGVLRLAYKATINGVEEFGYVYGTLKSTIA